MNEGWSGDDRRIPGFTITLLLLCYYSTIRQLPLKTSWIDDKSACFYSQEGRCIAAKARKRSLHIGAWICWSVRMDRSRPVPTITPYSHTSIKRVGWYREKVTRNSSLLWSLGERGNAVNTNMLLLWSKAVELMPNRYEVGDLGERLPSTNSLIFR